MRLPDGVALVRASNPSPMTLDGTNTWIAQRWVIDPGPADPAHLDAIAVAVGEAAEGIVITHGHSDHAEGAPALRERLGVDVEQPRGGGRCGPFEVVATPGHSADSVSLVLDRVCFTGDTVLGSGSVFIQPGAGSLAAYLDSLRRLRSLPLEAICPGHGPVVWDPAAKLEEYISHRLQRERWLLAALDRGARTHDELLDDAWSDAPAHLRVAARLTLEAHLEKLAAEGRLPDGVG